MNTIHIAVCINDSYVIPGSVLIQSIGANKGSEQIMIHVLSLNELAEKTRSVLNAHAEKNRMKLEYHVFKVPDEIVHACILRKDYWSPEIFAKLLISSILPDLSKVIVMDGDMIVCGNLLDIWLEDIKDYALAGVIDSGFGSDAEVEKDIYYNSDGNSYLNAGLLLINLVYHREHNIQDSYIEWIKGNSEKINFPEQTVINNVVYNKIKILPLKYNLQFKSYVWKRKNNVYYSREERLEAYFNPLVIHYIGPYKPWHRCCPHPFVNEWNRYLKQTVFSKYTKEFPRGMNISQMSLRAKTTMWLLWLNGRMLRFLRIFKCRWI